VEWELPFEDIRTFLPTLTAELLAENRHWLHPWALDDDDKLIIALQSYVVRTPHHTILIDTCIGNDKPRPGRPLMDKRTDPGWLNALAAIGLSVENIDIVMCTHLHVDHVGWNTRLENGRWVPTFPNARYLFSAKEFDYWAAENTADPIPHFADSVLPVVEANLHQFVRSDFVLDDHVRLLPTPGHTPDHYAVILGKGRDEAVMAGDLIHSPLEARYPDLVMRADVDQALACQTRRAFLESYCDTNTVCCTAHFPSPSRVRIKRWDAGFRCDPVD
jgi:glyoxylase-like metal-dependent hydrolase (beta-lactamase superfamily II)